MMAGIMWPVMYISSKGEQIDEERLSDLSTMDSTGDALTTVRLNAQHKYCQKETLQGYPTREVGHTKYVDNI